MLNGLAPARLAAALALAALCGCEKPAVDPAAKASAPPVVQMVLPHRGEIARTVSLPTFRVQPIQQAVLYAKVPGYLKTLSVDKGDTVQAGQFLGEIETPELLADEIQFRAETTVARTNYERMAEARRKAPDLVVPQTVDDLRGVWEIAEAKLQRTHTLLGYSKLVAPFAGTITARFVDPGAFIPAATSGTPAQTAAVVTLMDYSRLRIQAFVPEPETPFITNGLPALVTIEALPGKPFSGTVTRFSHALDETTKTMLVEIEMPNTPDLVRPGMYATVKLEVERKRDALLVPVGALLTEKAGTSVFLVAAGKAKKSPVTMSFNDGVNAEIASGLDGSQAVVLLGKQTLNDGQAVTVAEAK